MTYSLCIGHLAVTQITTMEVCAGLRLWDLNDKTVFWGVFFQVILSQQKGGSLNSRLMLEALTALFHISQMTTVEERKVSQQLDVTLLGIAMSVNNDQLPAFGKPLCIPQN